MENSASNIEAGGQFRARIDGYFYNALFDDPAMHNGEEGDVYVQNLIREFDDGSRTASCGIDQCTNATCSTSTLLLFQNYTSMIEADTEYTLSIERTDDGRIICKLDDETQEYTILTNIYPAAVPFRRLYTRTQDANGNVSALFDDVYTDNEQPTADAGDNVTVDGGDEVTLTGMGSDNDSGIIAYMWRQTSGPDVTLTTAGAASIARGMPDNTVVVRTDSSTSVTSFTAPDVDRDEELNFELTVIDSDGGSSTDTVTVNVDDGGGGGGCTLGGDGSRDSTLLLILALLSLVHLYRRRSGITRHD